MKKSISACFLAVLFSVSAHGSTEVVLVVDRSGSMQETLSDAQGGLTAFLSERKASNPDTVLTIVEFDDVYNVAVDRKKISDVEGYRIQPRGNTALLDAVARAAKSAWNSSADLKVFVVLTDGLENASVRTQKSDVVELIDHLKHDGWQVVFIGKGIDAFSEAKSYGIDSGYTIDLDASGLTWSTATSTLSTSINDSELSGTSTITLGGQDSE